MNNTEIPKIIRTFLNYISSVKGLTNLTLQGYKYDLILFFRFLHLYNNIVPPDIEFNKININDIDNEYIRRIDLTDIYAFLSYLQNDRENSNTTRARKIACLKSFFSFLYKKVKIIDVDLASELEKPKIKRQMPIYLKEEECLKLINSVKGRNEIRDRCIIILFLNTGLRLSELCSMNISSIREGTLIIKGKGDKERFIYLNEVSIKAINSYLITRQLIAKDIEHKDIDALFISEQKKRINKRTVEHLVKKAIRAANLNDKYSVHKLRHSAATLMYQGGADIRSVQEILGHESVATTQLYTHVEEKQLKEAVQINPLNKLISIK